MDVGGWIGRQLIVDHLTSPRPSVDAGEGHVVEPPYYAVIHLSDSHWFPAPPAPRQIFPDLRKLILTRFYRRPDKRETAELDTPP